MNEAIYYPNMRCDNKSVLASALFLWDSVSFIVPHHGTAGASGDSDLDEAFELVGRDLVPSDAAKADAAKEIRQLIEDAAEHRLDLGLTHSDEIGRYPIYPGKFGHELWDELVARDLTAFDTSHNNFEVRDTLGLYMMSMLAASAGAGRKRLVTDKIAAYESLYRTLADASPKGDRRDASPETKPLLTVPLRGLDFDSIPFSRLLELRRDESDLQRAMRNNFLASVDACIDEITLHAERVDVVDDIVAGFTDKMERDLNELKRFLRREAGSLLLSKEFGVAVLAGAWTSIEPISGSVLSTGALTRGLMQYQDKRRGILKSHASAWLYEARSGFKLY